MDGDKPEKVSWEVQDPSVVDGDYSAATGGREERGKRGGAILSSYFVVPAVKARKSYD